VIHNVTWQQTTRKGRIELEADGQTFQLPYQVTSSLYLEVPSVSIMDDGS
jgi:hypothetical protein